MNTSFKKLVLAVSLALSLPTLSSAIAADKKVALVIGNAAYGDWPLTNPVNDAADLAKTLKDLGFEVIQKTNLSADDMRATIKEFSGRLSGQDGIGMFYYAGHGVQAKGKNYLIPIGPHFKTEADLETQAVDLDDVLKGLDQAKTRVGFVVLDACRNNPFANARPAGRSLGGNAVPPVKGLARTNPPSGALVAYATAPGTEASDGSGRNGLYTEHLMRNMKTAGLTAEQVFKRTREGVERDSENAQSPREESSLKGDDFFFLTGGNNKPIPPESTEGGLWDLVKDSKDPGEYEFFIKTYPNSRLISLAKQRQQKLQQAIGKDGSKEKTLQAYAALEKGKTEEAENLFRSLASAQKPAGKAMASEGLAETAYKKGDLQQASSHADSALGARPNSVQALLIKARIAFQKKDFATAEKLLEQATADNAAYDFDWQLQNALLAKGNTLRTKNPQAALVEYQKAHKVNPEATDAVISLATALRDNGDHSKAMELVKKAQADSGANQVFNALAYQIQQDMTLKRDHEKQKMIDEAVKDLTARFAEQKKAAPKANADNWSSGPLSVSVLNFQETGEAALSGPSGLDALLPQEVGRELSAKFINVVDRALLDKVLSELKLGSSELADPETQLKLGRIMAARIIAAGTVHKLGGKSMISIRLIDTETTQILNTFSVEAGSSFDPVKTAEKLVANAAPLINSKFPLKGRLALVEGDTVVVNLGKKHGLQTGDVFNVLGEGQPIEINGKVIGFRESKQGSLRISAVDDMMAYATPIEMKGTWVPNTRIIKQQTASK